MFSVVSFDTTNKSVEIKTIEFQTTGAHLFSRRVIVARVWTKHDGLSKVRNSFWFGREGNKFICLGCRPDSQSRKTTSFRKCAPQSSHRPLLSLEFPIMSNKNCSCRSRVLLVVQKQWKTKRFRSVWPGRNRCASGLGRDVFFRGRPRERSVLSFLVLSLQNRLTRFSRKTKGRSRQPTMTYFGPGRN